jgi:hypothetical protein
VFILGVSFLCLFGHWLSKKRVDLAILSVGVDYFQVLSILAMSNQVTWPEELQRLFNVFSFANLNLDLLAPECSYPKMPYENKWAFIMALPFNLCLFAFMTYFFKYCHKRFVQKRTTRLHSHGAALYGSVFVCCYYCYLYITKTALDIFNCSPTDPPEGDPPKTYLEVVFVECGKPGGLHMKLLPAAIFFFVFFSLLFPFIIAVVLMRHSKKIKEDQVLRAKETGNTRATNPNCYDLRKKYRRLYYQFKPETYYWILVILARKFCIACAGLMFRRVPVFLLSFSLMVLFVSYSLQIRYQPYMSLSERAGVVKRYEDARSEFMGVTGAEMAAMGSKAQGAKKVFKFNERKTWDSGVAKAAYSYFWNYNTVEASLLFSACLVLINGLMFQSRQIVPGGKWERGLLAWTVLVIVGTTLYFSAVLCSEIVVGLGWMQKKTASKLLGHDTGEEDEGRQREDSDIEFADTSFANGMASNPIARAKAGKAAEKSLADTVKLSADNAQLAELVRTLRSENATLKKEAGAANSLRGDSIKQSLNFAHGSSKKKVLHGHGHGPHHTKHTPVVHGASDTMMSGHV